MLQIFIPVWLQDSSVRYAPVFFGPLERIHRKMVIMVEAKRGNHSSLGIVWGGGRLRGHSKHDFGVPFSIDCDQCLNMGDMTVIE
jgi:hypothetical protein